MVHCIQISVSSRVAKVTLLMAVLLSSAGRAEPKKTIVLANTVKKQTLSERLLYPAILAAFRIVPIYADAEGLVSDLRVDLGQSVRLNQPLAQITNPDPTYGFKPYALVSPINGMITVLDIAVGDRVTKAKPLMVIADLNAYKVKIHLTASDLHALHKGDQGTLTLQGKKLPVRIRAMSPMIDQATGTAPAELEIIASPKELRVLVPGSMGQVVFETNRHEGIILPEDAIVYKGKDPYVIRFSAEKTAQYLPVKIVKHDVGQVELAPENLKDGDLVVTGSAGYIPEGEALDVAPDAGGKGP